MSAADPAAALNLSKIQRQKAENEKLDVLVPEEASSPNEVGDLKSISTMEPASVLGINWLLNSEFPLKNYFQDFQDFQDFQKDLDFFDFLPYMSRHKSLL